jgi:hypothetical protein
MYILIVQHLHDGYNAEQEFTLASFLTSEIDALLLENGEDKPKAY